MNGDVKGMQGDCFNRHLFKLGESGTLAISRGDLTQWKGDAIVNAANSRMLGGAGVDGAIHKAAGPELLDACWDLQEVSANERCRPGEAVLTPGFRLPAKFIIHAVGPIYESEEKSAPVLENAFKNSLRACKEKKLKSIAFPALSCGVYGYPIHDAAQIALSVVQGNSESIDLVEFVLFGPDTYGPFLTEAKERFEVLEKDGVAENAK